MINKILRYGTTIGITVSLLGFIILKLYSTSDDFVIIIEKIQQLTITISCLFVLTTSGFINEKFGKILKFIGITFLIMIVMNLLHEFDIYTIEAIKTITLFLLTGLYFMYLNYFRKKIDKDKLDYLKISFLTFVLIGGFLKEFDLYFSLLKNINQIFFWVVITAILLNEYLKPKMEYVE